MTAKRYHDLDALRAFAMLLGILLHGLISFVGWDVWPVQDVNQSELYEVPLMFIHGFRMSLFFFVSGFFTMMMWQRRGTGGLLIHRAKRIILPFFFLGFLILPLFNNMRFFAEDARSPDDLGWAARQGDLDAIERHLQEGAPINGKYDKDFTPLHWAATMGRVEATKLLVKRGADLNSRDGHRSTPLLLAALFGRKECLRVLLVAGADPELENKDGARPLGVTILDKATTEWVARDILQVKVFWSEVRKGRREVVKLLESETFAREEKERVGEMNFWDAVRLGQVERLAELINQGTAYPSQKDSKQISALHWAAMAGRTEVIEFLVEKGADLNAVDSWYGSTPLHFACFLGQAGSVYTLQELGGNPMIENEAGQTPVDLAKLGRSLTEKFLEFVQLELEFEDIEEGRKDVIEILADSSSQGSSDGSFSLAFLNWYYDNYTIGGKFITHHLWFLYDLVYLILTFVLLASVLKFVPLTGFSKWLAESPLRLLWLVPLTFWAQYSMGGGGEDGFFGPSTAVWLEPDWIKLGYYAIFFGYGAICFQYMGFYEKVGRFWPVHLLVSVVVFVTALSLMEGTDFEFRYEIISLCASLFVWLMIFGLIGVFRKFFSRENPKIRFVSDSAYWLYVAHLPLIQVVQIWVSQWPVPSLIKLVFVCLVTTALLLLSYRYLIRYTPVGTMLNGKRTKSSMT